MNRKGFTLIELLAVIIVLGLVLVVTIPNVVTNINNNKLSSLNTLSKEVAKWVDNKLVEDKLSSIRTFTITDNWQCLENIKDSDGNSIASLYGLSSDDIKLDGNSPAYTFNENGKYKCSRSITNCNIYNTCSSIRIINGKAEVFLIGKDNGKYDSNGDTLSYSISTAMKGYDDVLSRNVRGE